MMKRLALSCLVVASIAACFATSAEAQKYPDRAITLVVPFPPGGLSDVPARIMAADLQGKIGVPVVIANKPGGSGVVGATSVWRADPDGYTILVNAISDVQNLYYLPVPYHAVKDFTPVALVTDGPPLVLMVNAKTPFKSLTDLINASKADSNSVSLASSGPATSPAIVIAQINAAAGSKILEVPYRGTAPASTAILAGEVQGGFVYYNTARQLQESGSARAIAITSKERFASWPELPTMAESGFLKIIHAGFVGLSAPPNTPPEIVAFLNKNVNAVIDTPDFRKRMEPLGMTVPSVNTPQTLSTYMLQEMDYQAGLAKLIELPTAAKK
jgi:tripartite-type tricarboxylate transporter receptor subunit TctC